MKDARPLGWRPPSMVPNPNCKIRVADESQTPSPRSLPWWSKTFSCVKCFTAVRSIRWHMIRCRRRSNRTAPLMHD